MLKYFIESAGFQIVLLVALLIPAVLFLLTEQNTLKAVKPENRYLKPGMVWLQLIPIFGQIWQFLVVVRIAKSIRNEILSPGDDSILGWQDSGEFEELQNSPTLKIGIAYCLFCTLGLIPLGPASGQGALVQIKGFFSLAGMICWIIYWVRLAQYKKKLVHLQNSPLPI